MPTKQVTLGADPEWFVKTDAGVIQTVCGKVGGTKENPIPMKNGFAYHEDNVVIELSVPSRKSIRTATEAIHNGRQQLSEVLAEKGLYFQDDRDTVIFPLDRLQDSQAQQFGCEADYDAYTGGKARSNIPDFGRARFAGGHLHIGAEFNCPKFIVAMFMDLALCYQPGLKNVSMGQVAVNTLNRYASPEYNTRSHWYGKPGIYRPKPYGIEYRTLNNRWCSRLNTTSLAYGMAHRVASWLANKSPTHIKTVVDKVPWLLVKQHLEEYKPTPADTRPPELRELKRYLLLKGLSV